MIRRLLVLLLLIGAAVWWARRLVGAVSGPTARDRPVSQPPARDEGRMVRDRVCNTFLPRSRALVERVGSDEHFFCSEACRQKFLASSGVSTA